jgi:aspartyl-tRNA(Asn)/glutamyl-tRNA(Gln) amidotransferase subunit A
MHAWKILQGFIPPYTATAVRRLLDAGMVIVGKTNTDEFAMGSSTENSAYGVTHNPWDLGRVPGGSSGGSAAAVAARYVPAALGTDTGGSVRQPASLCGVTGLKTTYGRVSRYGLVAFGSSLDTVGAFGRTAQDAAAIFSVMAGGDPRDATSTDVGIPKIEFDSMHSEKPLRGLRIGVPAEYAIAGVQPEVEKAVLAAVNTLKDLGAETREISLPHTSYALPVYYIIAPAEASANLARFDGVRYGPREPAQELSELYNLTRGRRFGPEVTRRVMIGTYALSAGYYDSYYGQAQRVRTLIRRDFEAAFKEVDLIAAPTSPGTAFKIGGTRTTRWRCILRMYSRFQPTWPGSPAYQSMPVLTVTTYPSACSSWARGIAKTYCCRRRMPFSWSLTGTNARRRFRGGALSAARRKNAKPAADFLADLHRVGGRYCLRVA